MNKDKILSLNKYYVFYLEYYKAEFTKIELPIIREISDFSFYENLNLEIADIKSCRIIGNSAFLGCKSLKEIDLKNAYTINNYAFYKCENLKNITLNNIKYIGDEAFGKCTNLNKVVIDTPYVPKATYEILNDTAISKGFGTIHVREELLDEFKSTYPWSLYKMMIVKIK